MNKVYTVSNINNIEIFKITRKNECFEIFNNNVIKVYEGRVPRVIHSNFITDTNAKSIFFKGVSNVPKTLLDDLEDNDIISVNDNGKIKILWKNNSNNNVLFLTDACNSKCIMCPQKYIEKPEYYYNIADKVIKLIKNKPEYICITGGEPTILKDKYIHVLKKIKMLFPEVSLLILTNGKNFSDFDFVKNAIINTPNNTIYGIPIYSANSKLHDYIVGSAGSFQKTILGIYNLYKFRQLIEIRVVISKINYKDLNNIAHFIYWNFPFVEHVTFMGLETHGIASKNLDDIWIEPMEYIKILDEAIYYLHIRKINVSIYNLPLCLLNDNLQKFARDSISSWKKVFLNECEYCKMKEHCSGFFSTSVKLPSGIRHF